MRLIVGGFQPADYASMPDSSNDRDKREPVSSPEMDFRIASFPSDALSVKRLRAIFPQHFDGHGLIVDGYANNDFFFPFGAEQPTHLVRLTEMICDERVVAAGAFYETLGDKELAVNVEEREAIDESKTRLEQNLQFFKLADSPETARLLIRQIEEQGEQQARAARSASR